MEPSVVDQIQLNFNSKGLLIVNAAIGLMMLGVALELKLEDFKRVIRSPKAPALVFWRSSFFCLHLPLY